MHKLTALLVLGLAVGCNEPKVSVELKGQPVPAQPRYQIVYTTHGVARTFLLDTQEGRAWQLMTDAVTPNYFWPVEVVDEKGLLGVTPGQWFDLRDRTEKMRKTSESN